jgi:hypothetical protein
LTAKNLQNYIVIQGKLECLLVTVSEGIIARPIFEILMLDI